MDLLRASIISFVSCWNAVSPASAAESVQFEGAHFQAALTTSQAMANGVPIFPPAPKIVQGYVQKPDGPGPFPAVIVLHGCAGLGSLFDPHSARNFWPDLLISWGYAVLVVDSFTLRGVGDTCGRDTGSYRVQDAFGALLYLSEQPYVDRNRVALLGFSAGGIATLEALKRGESQIFDFPPVLKFKAGVAFYPCFGSSLDSEKPILILNGESDDWSRQSVCESMMNWRPASATSVRLVSFPNSFHDFDRPAMHPGRMGFGHWLEYNPDTAKQAAEEVRNFLTEHLKDER
jgi:dienelactone hydrolase